MTGLNKVFLMGNVAAELEVRFTPKGLAVCDLRLAVNRRVKEGERSRDEATFVDVTLWGKQAELAGACLKKGSGVLVEGRLQVDAWVDKKCDVKRSKLCVVGEFVQFLERGRAQGEDAKGSFGAGSGLAGGRVGTAAMQGDEDVPF